MREIRVGGISEDTLDCKGGTKYGNGPKWGEQTDCVLAEQNVYFSFHFIIL